MTEATDLQLAQTTEETVPEDTATAESQQAIEEQPAQAETAAAEAAQEVPVSRPAAGETTVIQAEPAARYVIAFDPDAAQVQIDGNDFILLFEDGGRVVFANLVLLAAGEQPPSLQVGGTTIGGNLIVAQAQALAGQQPTLETAAGNQPGPQIAGGSHAYDDNLGSLIAPLEAQPDIPYVQREFRLIDLEPITPAPLEEPEPVIPALTALPSFGTVSEQFLPPRSPSGSQFDPASGPGSSGDPTAPNVAYSGTLSVDQSNGDVITALQLSDGTIVAPVGAGGASVTVTYDRFSFGPITAGEGDFLFTTPLGNVLLVDHETGQYLYVLADNEAQPGIDQSGANDTIEELFTCTVTDSFDQTASATLSIEIQDDAPTAVDEAQLKIYENGTVVAPDSVLENDTEGADGTETVASIGVTGDAADQVAVGSAPVSIAGTYGTLTINALGEYSYSANDLGDPPPANPVDTFVYTIVDEDGDSSQATISILVKQSPTGSLAVASGEPNNYVPEDVPTALTLTANTGGSPLDPNDGLAEIVVDFGTAIDLDGSDPETQWQLDPADRADMLTLPGVTGVTLADGGSVLTITLDGTTQSFSADLTMTTPDDSDVDLDGVTVTVTAVDTLYGSTGTGSSTNDVTVDAIVDGTEVIVTAAPSGLQNQFVAIDLNTELHFGEDSTNVGNSADASQADVTDGTTADDVTEFVSAIVVALRDKDSGDPTGTLEYDSPLPTGITVTEDAANHSWTFDIDSSVSRADLEHLVESFSVKPDLNYSGTLEVEITTTTGELNTPPGSTLPASGDEANLADNVDIDSYSIDVEVTPITVHKQVDCSGGEPKPFNLVFIIDRSGSMNTTVPNSGGQSRFDIAEDAFRSLIGNIRGQGIEVANVRVLGFNTGTLDINDFDHLPTEGELDDFFDDLGNPNGGTRYEPPLQSASQFLSGINDSNPDVEYDNRILFLSDGGNNNSSGGFLLGSSGGNNNAGAYDDLAKLYGNVGDVGTDIPNLTIKSVGFGIGKSFGGDGQSNIPGNTPVNAYLALDQSDDNMVNGSAIVSNANNGADLADSFGSVVDPSLVIGTLFEGHTLVGTGGLEQFGHLGRVYDALVAVDNADRDAAAAGDVVANDGSAVTIKTENGGFLTVWFADVGSNLEGDFRYEGPPNYPGERMDTIEYLVYDDVGLQLGQLDVIISGQAPANGDFENGNLVDWDSIGSVYVEDNADLSHSNSDGDNFVAVLATNNANGLEPRDGSDREDEGVVEDSTLEEGNMTPVEDLGQDPDLENLALYGESDLESFLAAHGEGSNAVDLSGLVGDDLLDGAVIQTSFELDPLFGSGAPGSNANLSISFDWNFATDEGAGGQNDIAFAVVEGQLFLLGSVAGSAFSGGALDVGESEITYDRSTGWQTTTLNLGSPDGFTDVDGDNVIRVAFGVMDGGANVGENSALLLDNVQADVS